MVAMVLVVAEARVVAMLVGVPQAVVVALREDLAAGYSDRLVCCPPGLVPSQAEEI